MPPIEVGSAQRLGAIESRLARVTGGDTPTSTAPAQSAAQSLAATAIRPQVGAAPAVETSAALDAGAAPVDTDRVAQIRHAVESGNYPVIPTRIADAMIAAGVLLRSAQ